MRQYGLHYGYGKCTARKVSTAELSVFAVSPQFHGASN